MRVGVADPLGACACGCGGEIGPDSRGRPRRFIHGHNRRQVRCVVYVKMCVTCRAIKANYQYPADARSPDGRKRECRMCRSTRGYKTNPVTHKAWRDRNPDRYRQYRARRRAAPGSCNKTQFNARWEYYGGLCWVCRRVATAMDHVKPLAKGGTHWPANLRPICQPCNSRKGAKWPL